MSNNEEPKSCFGQVFNFKIGCFVVKRVLHGIHTCPYLELKTQPSDDHYKHVTIVNDDSRGVIK
jgi:hypothetical protein